MTVNYFFSRNVQHHYRDMSCRPCSMDNMTVKATCFCKSCEDPEPLCEECAKQHTRFQICKDHEICQDIKYFQETESSIWYTIKHDTCI